MQSNNAFIVKVKPEAIVVQRPPISVLKPVGQPSKNRSSPAAREQDDKPSALWTSLLQDGPEARLILDQTGVCLSANPKGTELALPVLLACKSKTSSFLTWLRSPGAEETTLKIHVDGEETGYVAHKFHLPETQGTRATLVMLRKPNLSSHLIQALSHSRALYKDISRTVPGLVWEIGADGCFSFVDGFDIRGIGANQLISRSPESALGLSATIANGVFRSKRTVHSVDIWTKAPTGAPICLSVSARPVRDKTGEWAGSRGIALNVTAERLDDEALDAASVSLQQETEIDNLTGLLNRRGIDLRLTKICRQLRAADCGGFLLFIDLDNFKELNDSFGHEAGDHALIALARLLKNQTRSHDLVARLGGDEFMIWMDATHAKGVDRLCQALNSAMPVLCETIGYRDAGLSLSIGIAALRPGQDEPQSLKCRADEAMYEAKRAGKGCHKFFDETNAASAP